MGLLAFAPTLTLAATILAQAAPAQQAPADPIREMQTEYVTTKDSKATRAYHFGSQGKGDVFSNHTSHTNRLIPVYVFGRKADLAAVTGPNSGYRNAERLKQLYGFMPENTLNPEAEYSDQADLYQVQKQAAERGAKYIFTVWFDGLDWETTQAAAAIKTGKPYTQGKGSGLLFQDYTADGSAQFGYYVTSPTHDDAELDADAQAIKPEPKALPGGYDALIAGPNPWTRGKLDAPGYLRGLFASAEERKHVESLGRAMHAFTDSSCSAGEYATGVKSANNTVNIAEDGRVVETLYQQLQKQGWKVGTVTSVPFPHASPAAMYAHNVYRDDYQDLAREMLGLPSILQQLGKAPQTPGLDVVIGTGSGIIANEKALERQGKNAVPGHIALCEADRKAIDAEHGGNYVIVETTPGVDGGRAVREAAQRAAKSGKRLFGLFGREGLDHLPYRTADGRYDPTLDINGKADTYTPADLHEQPTLADLTEAALTAISAEPGKPFALFVEAGDVDFALHANNLDNAVGAVYSGEAAIRVILNWIETHSNWDESVLIVTADHGHYMVIDDLDQLSRASNAKQ